MWPTDSLWANALIFAAAASAVVLFAALGGVLSQSASGRKALKLAPAILAGAILAYVALSLWSAPHQQIDKCIYAIGHPSQCEH